MTPVETNYLATLEAESQILLDRGRRWLGRRVPRYPRWRGADLLIHTGIVQRWATDIVSERRADRPPHPAWPAIPDAAAPGWFADGLRALVSCFEGADLSAPVWTISEDGTAAFWLRRMAHEAALHRWDAESMGGTPHPIQAEVAWSGLVESLDIHFVRPLRRSMASHAQGSLALVASDSHRVMLVDLGTGQPTVAEIDGSIVDADATLRGTASDLWLCLMGRRSAESLHRGGAVQVTAAFERLLKEIPDAGSARE